LKKETLGSYIAGKPITVKGAEVMNPAFDITPPELVTGIVAKKGIIRPPYTENIPKYYK